MGDGTASRGTISAITKSSSTTATTITLTNANQIVFFEIGMLLVSSATSGSAPSTDTVYITAVNRGTGVLTGTSSTAHASDLSGTWVATGLLYVSGDLPSAGATNPSSYLAITGLQAWLPVTAPTSGDNFWGVDRSADPTRLAGVRYDGRAYTIEEGITNALALLNREGGKPDLCIMDFASYAALVNALGAKVVNVQVKHDEVDVAFDGIRFQSAYGVVTVLADRSCPPQTAYLLTMKTFKLRSLGKVPHILTYGKFLAAPNSNVWK